MRKRQFLDAFIFSHVYVVLIYENCQRHLYNSYQWSSNLSKLNPLPWSSYLQHCRENISKHTRNDNDVYFVHLLELQRISENIKHSGIRGIQPEQQTGNSYIGVHIKILMSELQKFRASLPENLQHNGRSNITPSGCF